MDLSIINQLQREFDYNLHLLTLKDTEALQNFLNLFDDFFILCEGEKGRAEELLTSCPAGKEAAKDKMLIGLYDKKKLIGLIDMVKDYPQNHTWTIGYFLVHPHYRGKGIGSGLMKALDSFKNKGAFILRCVVQDQNPQALKFWKKNGFFVRHQSYEVTGLKKSKVFILEKYL